MRLPVSKPRVFLYGLGAALVVTVFAFLSRAVPSTFADDTAMQPLSESHFVTIHDQDNKLTVKTSAITVREALERADITYSATDRVEPAIETQITEDNFHINIYRSRPALIIDGTVKKYAMVSTYDPASVAEAAGFTIYDGDAIELIDNQNFLEAGDATTYQIVRNGGQTVTVETTIPYAEETVQDANLANGEKEVRGAGEDGRKVTKYQVNFVDGVEVSRELISEEIVKEPVNKVVAVGSKKSIAPEWETCAGYARQAGVSEADLYAALTLIYHESGCRVDAQNASSGAYGIPQALPGSKMASAGADWQTNPVTQIRWMSGYVKKYGGWQGALDFWWCTGTCNGVAKSGHWY